MNSESKRLISNFLFVNGIILCAVLVALGSITVVERTEYNMYRRHYGIIDARADKRRLQVNVDGKEIVGIDFSDFSDYEKYTDYLAFSYGGNVYYLIKTAKELFFE